MPELVEEDVELELGAEVAEAAVAEGLEGPVGDEGAQQVDVGDEGLQVGVLVRHRLPGLKKKSKFDFLALVLLLTTVTYLGFVEAEDPLAEADVVLVRPALGEVAVEGVLLGLGRVDRVI